MPPHLNPGREVSDAPNITAIPGALDSLNNSFWGSILGPYPVSDAKLNFTKVGPVPVFVGMILSDVGKANVATVTAVTGTRATMTFYAYEGTYIDVGPQSSVTITFTEGGAKLHMQEFSTMRVTARLGNVLKGLRMELQGVFHGDLGTASAAMSDTEGAEFSLATLQGMVDTLSGPGGTHSGYGAVGTFSHFSGPNSAYAGHYSGAPTSMAGNIGISQYTGMPVNFVDAGPAPGLEGVGAMGAGDPGPQGP